MATDPNERTFQAWLVEELEALGLPTPQRNCVIQVQPATDANGVRRMDLVARVRYVELVKRLPWLNLTPCTESRFEGAALVPPAVIRAWLGKVALDSLAMVREDWLSRGLLWPSGWPRIPLDRAEADAAIELPRPAMA